MSLQRIDAGVHSLWKTRYNNIYLLKLSVLLSGLIQPQMVSLEGGNLSCSSYPGAHVNTAARLAYQQCGTHAYMVTRDPLGYQWGVLKPPGNLELPHEGDAKSYYRPSALAAKLPARPKPSSGAANKHRHTVSDSLSPANKAQPQLM
jgi:hypothetical protein